MKRVAELEALIAEERKKDEANKSPDNLDPDFNRVSLAKQLSEQRDEELKKLQGISQQIVLSDQKTEVWKGRTEELTSAHLKLEAAITKTKDELAKLDFARLDNAGQLSALNAKVVDIKTQLHAVGIEAETPNEALAKMNGLTDRAQELVRGLASLWGNVTSQIAAAVGEAAKLAQQSSDALKDVREKTKILLDEASGDKVAVAADRAKRAYDETLRSLLAKKVPEEEAKKTAQEYADAVQKQALAVNAVKDAKTGERAIQKDITELTREQANLLADIRGKQQAIPQNPFLSSDQKQQSLIPLITQEIAALNAQIAKEKDFMVNTALDPAQHLKIQGEIKKDEREVDALGNKLKTLSFGGTVRAELTAWVNQFGTTAKQVAGIITNTLNTAIASTSQALTSLIFKTGNWKQAFASAAQSIVQNLIQILLQWVLSQTVMKALSAIFRTEQTTQTSAAAKETASAWASAATAASIATEGEADLVGTAALAAAMIAGKGIVTGTSAFERGGYTFGREGKFAGLVHGEEFVFSAPAVRSLGVGYLDSLHSSVSRPSYSAGGYVGNSMPHTGGGAGRTPSVHIFNFTDVNALRKAVLQSDAGKKILVDTINGSRVELGLA